MSANTERKSETTTPKFDPYFYMRHPGDGHWPWGVGYAGSGSVHATSVLVSGLDKNVAAAVACLLNGEIGHARDLLSGLPTIMEVATRV